MVATADERLSQVGDRTPVGTTMALIEQGSATYAAVHARLHESQRMALGIICRLNFTNPHEESLARFRLTAEDFKENDDVEPVSDPNIFSEAQRYAQLQEQIKLLQVFPQLNWNMKELARRALQLLKVDGADVVLPKDPDPVTADPVSENVEAAKGKPLKATVEQDHQAHIQAHLTYILNPMHAAMPMPDPSLGMIMGHIKEHLLLAYEQACRAALPTATAQLASQDVPFNPDQVAALASNMAAQQIGQQMQQLTPLLQQAGQIVGQKSPQPPVDPAVQKTFEAAMAEIQRKTKADTDRLGFEQQKATNDVQTQQALQASKQQMEEMKFAAQQALEAQKEENRKQIAVISEMTKKEVEELRAQVAISKNDADNQQKQMTELLKNRDDNQTQVIIAQMKEQLSAMQPQVTEQPQNDAMLKEMQRMLGEIEKAKTGDALTTTVEALRQMMAGQTDHQLRTMMVAERLMSAE